MDVDPFLIIRMLEELNDKRPFSPEEQRLWHDAKRAIAQLERALL